VPPMHEKSEKFVSGAVIERSSSDSAIIRKIDALKQESFGLNGVKFDATNVETLAPRSISKPETVGAHLGVSSKFEGSGNLSHKDSAFGHAIVNQRNLKKAA